MRSTSGESPLPGKVSAGAQMPSKGGVSPRAPMKSNPEHTEPGGYQLPRGVAPRAPSASVTSVTERPGGLSEGDVRMLAQAVARELTKPLEDHVRALESRIASLEAKLDRTERTLESTDPGGVPAVAAPAPAPAPAPVASAFVPVPVPAPLLAATPAPSPVVAAPSPAPAPVAPKPAALAPAPKVDPWAADVHLSSDELGMFDAGKRRSRIAVTLVLVVLTIGGALVAAMVASRS